ncbi:MAG: MazG family protein [Ornithinibacter sp.]
MPAALVVTVSPRLPGLLSPAGWRAVTSGSPLLALPGAAATAAALRAEGWEVGEIADAGALDAHSDVVLLAGPGVAAPLAGVDIVEGTPEPVGARLLDVVRVMDRLRSPGGCPWDAEQTHASLAPYLVEEAHEVLHAIEGGDRRHLAEELGDVLLQVVFHARVAEEAVQEPFDIDTVAGLLVDKLVRRHPHVFADGEASTPAEVEPAWERIKASETAGAADGGGGYGADLLHGIPTSLPGDLAAEKVLARVRRRDLTPTPDAVARREQARADLVAAEAEVRAALAELATSTEQPRPS